MVLTCTGGGSSQRWTVDSVEQVFTTGVTPRTQRQKGLYKFTVISSDIHHFETTLSTVTTAAMNNTMVECNDGLPADTVTIKISGLWTAIDF